MPIAPQDANRILATLGNRPTYEWKWSEDLFLVVPAQWVESGGLLVPREPRRDKLAPDLKSQWVIAYCHNIGDEAEWRAMVPAGGPLYPGRSLWIPVSSPGGWCAMKPGLEPTLTASQEFVGIVNKDRKASFRDDVEAVQKGEARIAQAGEDKMADDLDPFTPIRPWIPGKRSYPVWHRNAAAEQMIEK